MLGALPSLPTQSDRLRLARERAGFTSARGAALAFGWNENTYKSHESGVRGSRGLPEAALRKYGRAFRISWEWIATGRDGKAPVMIDIVSFVGAGAEVYPADSPFDEIEPPPDCPPGAFAVRVRGDSQLPIYEDGDVLICVPEHDGARLMWKRAIVDLEDGRRLLKQIAPGTAPGLFSLLSVNSPPINDVRITQVARIAWHKPS